MSKLFDGIDDTLDFCGIKNNDNYTIKIGLPGNKKGQNDWKQLLKETDDLLDKISGANKDDIYKSTKRNGEINEKSDINTNIKSKTDINVFKCDFNDDKSLFEYGLSSLNKVWGGGTEIFNNGCVSENVSIPCSKMKVVYSDSLGRAPDIKKVLKLEAHGDKYSGNIKGLEQTQVKYKNEGYDIPNCPQLNHITTGKRVGGVVSTINNFGPGSYEVIARVPKTSAPSGRGYVFAMWTFHYEEHYNMSGKDKQSIQNSKYPDYNPKEENEDEYCIVNHEIDIEIPGNPAIYQNNNTLKQDVFTWNTMNMNTWIGDNLKYDNSSWYREIVALPKDLKKTFISENGEFHSYKFVWNVPKIESISDKPYVDFYFDNEKIYRETCFIPSRSGKFLVGPWFGWWGFDQKMIDDKLTNIADFDSVSVLISEINIIPNIENKIVEYPQLYDQIASYDKGEMNISCDF